MQFIKERIWIAAIVVIFGSSISAHAIEISNFRTGLVCPGVKADGEASVGQGWICFETDQIYVTGQGTCTFNGQIEPCTWYGFEFEYTADRPMNKIQCVVESNFPGDIGNPEEITAADATSFEYELTLTEQQGRFFNPQYTVFSVELNDNKPILEETSCSSADVELFRFKQEINLPPDR